MENKGRMSKAQKPLPWLPWVLQPLATLGAVSGAEHQRARGACSILVKALSCFAWLFFYGIGLGQAKHLLGLINELWCRSLPR